jgi:hypothetical protein
MNRRRFIHAGTLGAAALAFTSSAALARPPKAHFQIALAGLPRHRGADELANALKRYRRHGYTGIWIENDYLRWTWDRDPDQGFGGNWRLFNLFDFTLCRERNRYANYLRRLDQLCAEQDLDIYASFWLPKLNAELTNYLKQTAPTALGKTRHEGETRSTFCTCAAGPGLKLLGQAVEQFLRDFPRVRGLKVSTEDNACYVCDENCPNARGATQAENAANLFETVQQSMLRVRPDAHLLLYPWFWKPGWGAQILGRLQPGYFVVTKMEACSLQPIEIEREGEPLFDSSIVSEKPGPLFFEWAKRVGPERIIDMVPVGTGIDDFFLAAPPYPGRIYRRFKTLASHGVRCFLDFECGGHQPCANEEAVAVFNREPDLTEAALLEAVARRLYRRKSSRAAAIRGWQAFDRGFGKLPIGLGGTGCPGYSGRIGFGWSLCVATPMIREAFGSSDQRHARHWFSPYNFFNSTLAERLDFHFTRTLDDWSEACQGLLLADALEGGTSASRRESLVAQAHVLSLRSVRNWCRAARCASRQAHPDLFDAICSAEMQVTRDFRDLVRDHPWLWDNNCWHPHQTPLSQKGLGLEDNRARNAFDAKLEVMNGAD